MLCFQMWKRGGGSRERREHVLRKIYRYPSWHHKGLTVNLKGSASKRWTSLTSGESISGRDTLLLDNNSESRPPTLPVLTCVDTFKIFLLGETKRLSGKEAREVFLGFFSLWFKSKCLTWIGVEFPPGETAADYFSHLSQARLINMRFDTHWDLTAGFLLRGGKYNPVPNEQMKSSSGFFLLLSLQSFSLQSGLKLMMR